jgi:NAD(P)-dependent dehydrogenase (short-subunit alcohol dehydrogenase family)
VTEPRTVVVTGACGGIGRATVAAFREGGWQTIGVDRADRKDLEMDDFIRADIAADDGVQHVFDRLRGLDRLDALVNNAALQVNHSLVETSDEDWTAVMNTNVRAAFQLIRALKPLLAASRGAIVNVSSVHAIATSPNVAAYAISKGALVALTRTAALELAADGIRCNAVLPGAVLTPMLEEGLDRRPHPDGAAGNLQALADRTPLGFVAMPDQISPTIVHLADSAASPYTTGQALVVDGGATIRLGTE